MIKKLFLLLVSTQFLCAEHYPSFSSAELRNIEKSRGTISRNRVQDYINTIDGYKKLPQKKQLVLVNSYLNGLLPKYDDQNQKQIDYWETPKEFLTLGYGDCEDYAIIKYFTLVKLGFKKEKLYLTVVSDRLLGNYHMVLSYFETAKKTPLILDNLSFKVLDLNSRHDLKYIYFINEKGVFTIRKDYSLIRQKHNSQKFHELLAKISKNI